MAQGQSLHPILQAIDQRLQENRLEVPLLPEVAGRVVRLTQDPDSDALELSNLMQGDQSLAAHVMHIANSAAYSPNVSIVSLQQAVTRLGMKTIAEIALAATLNSAMFDTPGFEGHIQKILHRSFATGLWAKEIARACRKNVEAAFLAGLLHDMGRPVAVQCALEIADELGQQLTEDDVIAIEQSTQRAIGMHVLEQWEMPAVVREVVAYFADYQKPHNGQLQTMIVVAGAAVADYYMDAIEAKVLPVPELEELRKQVLMGHPVFAEINLYPDEIEAILARVEQVQLTMEAMGQ